MIITRHAINQWKKRFGQNNRTSSGKKIAEHIRKQITDHRIHSYYNAVGTLDIITDEFRAVWDRGRVVTITRKQRSEPA
jgi:hypothetical protein